MVGDECHEGFGIAGSDPTPFKTHCSFSSSRSMESENPLLLLLPLYLMTLNVSCEQFISLSIGYVKSGTDQINQKYFWNQKKV